VRLVSKLTGREPDEICTRAGIPLLLAPSIKAGLDIDWSDPKQKATAVDTVCCLARFSTGRLSRSFVSRPPGSLGLDDRLRATALAA